MSLVENGTHVLFASEMGSCTGKGSGEITLAKKVLQSLEAGMLCLADRYYFGYDLWLQAKSTGADLLWRARKDLVLPREKELPDGSFYSTIYHGDTKDRRNKINGVTIRVIEYKLEDIANAEPFYRLITTILEPKKA